MADEPRLRTPRETLQAVYGLGRTFQMLPPEQSTDTQIGALRELVFALIMEVEALRTALIDEAQLAGIPPHASSYGRAYRDTALLTRNNKGMYGGWEKLLGQWVGWPERPVRSNGYGWPLREVVMMRRLGFSEQEIDQYVQETDELHIAT